MARSLSIAGTWGPSKAHKGGSSVFFHQKEQITLPAQLLKKRFLLLPVFGVGTYSCAVLPSGPRGRQPLDARSGLRRGDSGARCAALCGPSELRARLPGLLRFAPSQPGHAAERSGERRARAVREGIRSIPGSARPAVRSLFAPALPPQTATFLIHSNVKGEGGPFNAKFQLAEQVPQRIPLVW